MGGGRRSRQALANLADRAVRVTQEVHRGANLHDLQIDPAERLLDPAVAAQQSAAIVQLFAGRLTVVADGVNRLRSPDRAMLVITHYQRLLNHIVPDVVHVLSNGRIVRTGGSELALELEAKGYAPYQDEAA